MNERNSLPRNEKARISVSKSGFKCGIQLPLSDLIPRVRGAVYGDLTRLFRINQLSLKFLAFLGFFFNSFSIFLDYNSFSSAALPVLLYNRFTAHVFYSGFNFIYLGSSTLFVQHLILAIFIIYSTVPIFLLLELIFFHSFRKII